MSSIIFNQSFIRKIQISSIIFNQSLLSYLDIYDPADDLLFVQHNLIMNSA